MAHGGGGGSGGQVAHGPGLAGQVAHGLWGIRYGLRGWVR